MESKPPVWRLATLVVNVPVYRTFFFCIAQPLAFLDKMKPLQKKVFSSFICCIILMPLLDAQYNKQTRIFLYDSVEYSFGPPKKHAKMIQVNVTFPSSSFWSLGTSGSSSAPKFLNFSANFVRICFWTTILPAGLLTKRKFVCWSLHFFEIINNECAIISKPPFFQKMIYWMCKNIQRCSAKGGCIYHNHRPIVEEHGGLSAGVIVAIAFGSLALLIICGVIVVLIIYKFFPSVFGRMAPKRGNSKSSIASTHRTTMMNQAYSAISTYFRTRRTAKTKKVSVSAKPSTPTKYRPASGHPSSGATKQPTNFGPGAAGSKPNKTKYPSSATPKHQSKYPPSDGSYTQFQRKH